MALVVTDAAGRTLTFSVSAGHVTSVVDTASPARTVSYTYDGNGNLASVTDVNGGITSFAYDSSHRMVEMRFPRYYASGALPAAPASCTATPPVDITSNVYDSSGRVICQWDPDGRQTSFDYTSIAGATKVTDPNANVVVDYFTSGLLTSETKGYGTAQAATWTYGYDPASGAITQIVDPNGHATHYYYDTNGNLLAQVDPLGRAATSTYNAYNQVTSVTPPALYGSAGPVTTTYSYDEPAYSSGGAGNLTTVSTPILSASGTSEGTQVTHYVHASSTHPGDVTSMIDPGANTWTYTYDAYGDKTSVSAPATADNSDGSGSRSNVTKYVYNTATGWVTEQLAPRFVLANPTATTCATPAVGCSTSTHDNMGRSLVATDGDGHTATSHYDADGNLDYTIDGDTNKTTYTYDPAGQPTAVTRADTTQTKTNYWPDGTVEDQINANNADTHYTYDPLGHVTGVTDPDSRTTGYRYDPVGNLLVRADPTVTGCTTTSTTKGCTIYTYDAANQLTAINYNDPDVTSNVTAATYDGNGRKVSMTEQVHGSTTTTVTSTWAYDSLGRLTSATDINANTVSYGYDTRSDLTTITYPGNTGTVARTFDPAGRISAIADWKANTTNYTYDADSDLATRTSPTTGTAVVDTSVFDNADNLSSIAAKQGSTSIDSFTYSYDAANQVNTVTSTGVPTDNHTYTYNPLQQLASSTSLGSYGYDKADNPVALAAATSTKPTVQAFDPANQLATSSQITLVGTNNATGTAKSTTVTLPAGTTTSDQILAAVTVNNGVTLTPPHRLHPGRRLQHRHRGDPLPNRSLPQDRGQHRHQRHHRPVRHRQPLHRPGGLPRCQHHHPHRHHHQRHHSLRDHRRRPRAHPHPSWRAARLHRRRPHHRHRRLDLPHRVHQPDRRHHHYHR